jgi:predicted esterase
LPQATEARPGAADPVQDWTYFEAARPAYALHDAQECLGLFLHNQGHHVPPEAEEALYAWFERWL